MINGYSFWVHNEKETAEIVEELFGNIEVADGATKIEMINGTGDGTVSERLRGKLKEKGYNVIAVENTTEVAKTTVINRENKEDDTNYILELLGVGTQTVGRSNGLADITIILGKDYIKEEGN